MPSRGSSARSQPAFSKPASEVGPGPCGGPVNDLGQNESGALERPPTFDLLQHLLDPNVTQRGVNKSGLPSGLRRCIDGMPVFRISARGAYEATFATREMHPEETLATVQDALSFNLKDHQPRAERDGFESPEPRLPHISGKHVVDMHQFHSGGRSFVVLGRIHADAMRIIHMEMLSQVSHVLGGLHGELHPHLSGSEIPNSLRPVVDHIVGLDVPSMGPVDLAAPTSWLAAESLRRMALYAELFETIERTPGAMLSLARVITKYRHPTFLADTNHAIAYYGQDAYCYLQALVLRQDENARPFAEDYLAANQAAFEHTVDSAAPTLNWSGDPLATIKAPAFKPLSRHAQELYLGECRIDIRRGRLSPAGKRSIAQLMFCKARLEAHPASMAMTSHMRAMTVPMFEKIEGDTPPGADGIVRSPALMLPQDISARAARVRDLLGEGKSLRSLCARLGELIGRAKQLTAEVFSDGHLALQSAALLQRPVTLRGLSSKLLQLEKQARDALELQFSRLALNPRRIPTSLKRPAAPSAPAARPAWWTDDEPVKKEARRPTSLSLSVGGSQFPVKVLQEVVFAPDVRLPSQMSRRDLGQLLLATFDPGTFGLTHTDPITASAASAQYHLRKHGAYGAFIEDYIFEARAVFRRDFVGEVSARAGTFDERIKMVHSEHYYGCYSWDERVLTFCNRRRCGEHHFPGLRGEQDTTAPPSEHSTGQSPAPSTAEDPSAGRRL